MNYQIIAKKIEELLKKRIVDEGLVDSGSLLNSIEVTYEGGRFLVYAEDYFKYLDEEYNLSSSILDSEIITKMISDAITEEIEKNI